MKKEAFADKMARKAFEKDDVKRSWEAHVKAFGPILEPAFTQNLQARIHLTAALNMISNRNLAGGLMKLKALQKSVVTDADKAARCSASASTPRWQAARSRCWPTTPWPTNADTISTCPT